MRTCRQRAAWVVVLFIQVPIAERLFDWGLSSYKFVTRGTATGSTRAYLRRVSAIGTAMGSIAPTERLVVLRLEHGSAGILNYGAAAVSTGRGVVGDGTKDHRRLSQRLVVAQLNTPGRRHRRQVRRGRLQPGGRRLERRRQRQHRRLSQRRMVVAQLEHAWAARRRRQLRRGRLHADCREVERNRPDRHPR